MELLSRATPEWSIQVVAGRLIVWKGRALNHWLRWLYPHGEKVHEVVQFAAHVRELLIRQGLSGM